MRSWRFLALFCLALALLLCHYDIDLFGVEQALDKKEIKMKTLRMLTLTSITVLVMSAWVPTYAYAMSDGATQPAASQMARLTVNNRTGGTLYVKLSGSANYWFSATSQGKTVFNNNYRQMRMIFS